MTCTGCQRCEDGPVVTLIDGRVVCDICEDYRAECEARSVLNMPDKQARRRYLAEVAKRRGQESADALSRMALAIWERGRA